MSLKEVFHRLLDFIVLLVAPIPTLKDQIHMRKVNRHTLKAITHFAMGNSGGMWRVMVAFPPVSITIFLLLVIAVRFCTQRMMAQLDIWTVPSIKLGQV